MRNSALLLVTGATGYVGGRLVPRLLDHGYRVRVLVRDPQRLISRPWKDRVEVVQADALKPQTLRPALERASIAYYLIHSMIGGSGFRARDQEAARNFGRIARQAGVEHIVYLGGLADPQAGLSRHMQSRQLVGELLRASGVSVTEFRASMIIGSGSASFEMVRYLAEGLPVLLCPHWVSSRVQPIGIRDLLAYLLAALRVPASTGRIVEIGGADVMDYRQVLLTYARVRGYRRLIIPLPFMHPKLCAAWVKLLTPIPAELALPLIESLRSNSVVSDPSAAELFPLIRPANIETAFERALERLEAGTVETTWQDAAAARQLAALGTQHLTREGVIMQRLERAVDSPRTSVYDVLLRLGEQNGWEIPPPVWTLTSRPMRGGPRGRSSKQLQVGDVVGRWRVEAMEPNRLLRLQAQMDFPGRAWADLQVRAERSGQTRLAITVYFIPRGTGGVLYWYAFIPFRTLALTRLLRRVARQAEAQSA
jgi:uncharacterized protein YbjT (DUF2867 family)